MARSAFTGRQNKKQEADKDDDDDDDFGLGEFDRFDIHFL